jgi:hypothetical protein
MSGDWRGALVRGPVCRGTGVLTARACRGVGFLSNPNGLGFLAVRHAVAD